MVGVYKITNLLNQDSYIGSSKNIEERWKKHLYLYNREGRHYSYHLYRAMRKYGVENFKFEVLELCSEQDRTERERYYFFLINPKYNEMVPRDNRLFSEEKRQEFKDRCKEAWKTKSQDSKNKAFENLKKRAYEPSLHENGKTKETCHSYKIVRWRADTFCEFV